MSKKNVSPIVSGAGWTSGFWHLMDKEMRRQGWTDKQIHALVTETEPEDQSIAEIVRNLRASRTSAIHNYATYQVFVDYTRTLADMIKAGQYDWVNDNIVEKNFPLQRPNVVSKEPAMENGPYRTPGVGNSGTQIVLVHLNKVARMDEVLRHMDQIGLLPGRIEELLALGEKYPNLQLDFPIVAPGSVRVDSCGGRGVPGLGRGGFGRLLRLHWRGLGYGWDDYCRFLAVSK